MMFTVPTFNVNYDWWLPGNPTTNPPDVVGLCQLYVNSKPFLHDQSFNETFFIKYLEIRVDRSWWSNIGLPTTASIWRIFDFFGNKWYFRQAWWEYTHRGFPNEYITVIVTQCDSAGNSPDTGR